MGVEDLLSRHPTRVGADAAGPAGGAGGHPQPSLRTVVVTCMDARIDVYRLFRLHPGEVHVLRNAGGVVTDDVIRSITISQRKLGTTDVLLVHHTGCGMATFTDEEFADELAIDCGARPPWRAHAFRDPVAAVRGGITRLRRTPFLRPGTPVRGFVLDIVTFALDEVHPVQEERDPLAY